MTALLTHALASVVSLFALWLLTFSLYRSYSLSAFRVCLFRLRDELFDDAADEKVAFNEPAYKMLRERINNCLQFAHRYTLIQVLSLSLILRPDQKKALALFDDEWEPTLEQLPPEARVTLEDINFRFEGVVFRHVILCSPEVLITVVPPVLIWLAFKHMALNAKTSISNAHQSVSDAHKSVGDKIANGLIDLLAKALKEPIEDTDATSKISADSSKNNLALA